MEGTLKFLRPSANAKSAASAGTNVNLIGVAAAFVLVAAVLCYIIMRRTPSHHRPVATILVHGGAGNIEKDYLPGALEGIKAAAKEGYHVLKTGGTAVEAVEAAVRVLEQNDHFNAGRGSVLTSSGTVEMDASIMNGADLNAGAVSIAKNVLHPVSLAKIVMFNSPHVFIVGNGLMDFADTEGVQHVQESCLITPRIKSMFDSIKSKTQVCKKFADSQPDKIPETVGAVALDKHGHVAAATSTGGLMNKHPGRVGDSPLIGSGTYADDEMGAVSATGHGETILKFNLAHRILTNMTKSKPKGDPHVVTRETINAMTNRLGGTGGAITIIPDGRIGVYHNSQSMVWAFIKISEKKIRYGFKYDKIEFEELE